MKKSNDNESPRPIAPKMSATPKEAKFASLNVPLSTLAVSFVHVELSTAVEFSPGIWYAKYLSWTSENRMDPTKLHTTTATGNAYSDKNSRLP